MMKQVVALGALVVFVFMMATAHAAEEAVEVSVTGQNVNLAKTLCGDDAPACEVNVLKVTEMLDADGNALEGYDGKMLHYLPADAAADLMTGGAHADKNVTVKGLFYDSAQAIMITDFEVVVAADADDGDDDDDWDDWDIWIPSDTTTVSQKQEI